MNDADTRQRFICLRARGWSFARLAGELQVSTPRILRRFSTRMTGGVRRPPSIVAGT